MHAADSVLLWSLVAAISSTQADREPCREVVVSPYVIPGGVADPAGRNGFVTNAEGGITALDLRNGTVLWETRMGHRPIAVTGERVYASIAASPGVLRVVGLDLARQGIVNFESDDINLPKDAQPDSLRWVAEQQVVRLKCNCANDKTTETEFVVDLKSGHIRTLTNQPISRVNEPAGLEKRAVRWQGVIDGRSKAVVLEETEQGQRLVLLGWNAGGVLQTSQGLLEGKRLVLRPALDGNLLCLRDSVPSPDQKADEFGPHAWSVFDPATGKQVARFPYVAGTQAISVLGPRAFCLVVGRVPGSIEHEFVSPRKLKAIDLRTGKTIWEHEVEGKHQVPVGN
jgi:hypothetical protein